MNGSRPDIAFRKPQHEVERALAIGDAPALHYHRPVARFDEDARVRHRE